MPFLFIRNRKTVFDFKEKRKKKAGKKRYENCEKRGERGGKRDSDDFIMTEKNVGMRV